MKVLNLIVGHFENIESWSQQMTRLECTADNRDISIFYDIAQQMIFWMLGGMASICKPDILRQLLTALNGLIELLDQKVTHSWHPKDASNNIASGKVHSIRYLPHAK